MKCVCKHCGLSTDEAAGGACASLSGPEHTWIWLTPEQKETLYQTLQQERVASEGRKISIAIEEKRNYEFLENARDALVDAIEIVEASVSQCKRPAMKAIRQERLLTLLRAADVLLVESDMWRPDEPEEKGTDTRGSGEGKMVS